MDNLLLIAMTGVNWARDATILTPRPKSTLPGRGRRKSAERHYCAVNVDTARVRERTPVPAGRRATDGAFTIFAPRAGARRGYWRQGSAAGLSPGEGLANCHPLVSCRDQCFSYSA
jgi:hypothetical protein